MKIFKDLKNQYFLIFLVFLFLFGIYLSMNVGITHDEFHDYYVWEANKNLIINIFFGTSYDSQYLDGGGKFYGVGFHYLSIPFELISNFF